MCSHASVCMSRLLEVVNAGENNADILYIVSFLFNATSEAPEEETEVKENLEKVDHEKEKKKRVRIHSKPDILILHQVM